MDQAIIEASGTAAEAERGRNMRQLLLRALRIVNRDVVAGLNGRGYPDLRSTHTTLLANIDLAGSSVTVAAARAGITKQAMGRLASELETAGYIVVQDNPRDGRARILELTDKGRTLMTASFEVMAELETRYAARIGGASLMSIREGLADFIVASETV